MRIEQNAILKPVVVVVDKLDIMANAEDVVLSGKHRDLILTKFAQAGLSDEDIGLISMSSDRFEPQGRDIEELRSFLANSQAKILCPIGSYSLEMLTGQKSLFDYHCSRLKSLDNKFDVIPMLEPAYVDIAYRDSAYISVACMKVAELLRDPKPIPERKFVYAQDFNTAKDYIINKILRAKEIALDIETGQGTINTMGFAISETEAIAIRTSPEIYTPEEHYALWRLIANVCESSQPKICQNFIYETLFLSAYGIELKNVVFDTMWAMKLLHPEFEKGLHNVGRIYTPFPFWKKDGDEWNNVKHWIKHLDYNCKDTTGTFAAYRNMLKALKARGLYDFYFNYLAKFKPCIVEMCSRGLEIDREKHLNLLTSTKLKAELSHETIQREFRARLGREVNPRSPAQLKKALTELGFKLPTKRNKDGNSKESADKKSLVKLYKKHPTEVILGSLMELSAQNKQISSYLDFTFDQRTNKIHYTLDGHGTETGRWSGYNDPWGRGFNPQTVPGNIKKIFRAPEGRFFVEIDLAQAESRYVAWESPEPVLMQMLQEGRDVHKYVASKIFNINENVVTKMQRQLGKKSGHSANYGVGPRTFAEACLVEMNISLTENEARRIIYGYYEVFPGVARRQKAIQAEIRKTKTLRTPLGRERVFYDRIGDDLFREAYAYAPQSTIPDITNHLMLFLRKTFSSDVLWLHNQVHDSLLLSVPKGYETEIAEAARDYASWHPSIKLAGGTLVIPVEVEYGSHWKPMENV